MGASLDEQMAVADVYGEALFKLAVENDVVDQVRDELESLLQLIAQDANFAEFLVSAIIDVDERRKSLEKMFRGKLSHIVLNTLLVLNDHDRSGLLAYVLRCYVLNVEEMRGQIEATAMSAVELSKKEKETITQTAAKLSGKQPLVQFVVDPDILGGLVLRIADWQFDNSLRSHLKEMEKKLLIRGEHGLEVGVQQ